MFNFFAQSYQYSDPYTYDTHMNSSMSFGVALGLMIFMFFLALATYALTAWMLSKVFKKAGVEPWKAWVPIYNNWVMLEMGGQKGYWAVLALIPLVNIVSAVFMIIAMYHIGLSFGKEGTFVLLAIFLPIVWIAWLAFDSSTWKGASVAQPTAPANPQQPVQDVSAPMFQPPADPNNDNTPPQA